MSEATAERYPFDSCLARLADAINPDLVSRWLAQYVCFDGARGLHVVDCRISTIRYRRHTRCVIQYLVTLRNAQTGQSHRQWVTGTVYGESGRAERRWRRAKGNGGVAFIPQLRMLVTVFPCDSKLPQAVELMSRRDPLVESSMLSTFGPDPWTLAAWHVEPVRYRTHLSLVVRYEITARNEATGRYLEKVFYIKAYPTGDQPRRVRDQLALLAQYSARAAGPRVDSPVAFLPHLNALLLPATSGRSLDQQLDEPSAENTLSAVRDAARAVARFNGSDAPMLRTYTAAEYISSLRRPAVLLEWACPDLANELKTAFVAIAREVRDVALLPTHRDMKPEHILIGEHGPAFIDLDSCAAADPILDVAHMLARIEVRGCNATATHAIKRAAEEFSDAYFSCVPADWKARFPRYYAGALLETAASLFQRQISGWPVTVRRLICTAAEVAGGSSWSDHRHFGVPIQDSSY